MTSSQVRFGSLVQAALPDILSVIFSFIPEACNASDEDADDTRKMAVFTLLSASQVCQAWRAVALDCPYPWAQLISPDIQPHNLVGKFLKVARSVPLSVESAYYPESQSSRFTKSAWAQVLSASERIRNIHIFFDITLQDDIMPLELFVLRSAPLLRSCQLDCRHYVERQHHDPPTENMTDPDPLFDGNAKALRCLSIHSCLLPFRVDFSGLSLKHLKLEIGSVSTFEPTLSEWLDILGGQPLEILTLHSFRIRDSTITTPQKVVQLPRLESLYLEGDIDHCGEAFGALVLPPTCIVHLDLIQTSPVSFRGMRAGLERFLSRWYLHNGKRTYDWFLQTNRNEEEMAMVRLEIADTDISGIPVWPRLKIEVHKSVDVPLAFTFWSLTNVMINSPLMTREAVIRLGSGVNPMPNEYNPNDLVVFLNSFRNASSITISVLFIDKLVPGLLTQPCNTNIEGKENELPLLLPNLKQITLEMHHDPEQSASDLEYLIYFQIYLRWRKNLGKGIPKVTLAYPRRASAPVCFCFRASDFYAEELFIDEGISRVDKAPPPACDYCCSDAH